VSYDLKISVTGLGVFTQDEQGKVHFLMPTTPASDGSSGSSHHAHGPADEHRHVPHVACLAYDTKYLEDGSADSGTALHKLDNQVLDLSDDKLGTKYTGSGDRLDKKMILNLTPLTDARVTHTLVEDVCTDDELMARVTLFNGGISCCAGAAEWLTRKIGGGAAQVEPMVFLVTWTIPGVTQNPLQLTLRQLDNSTTVLKLPNLRPVGGEIHLWVVHVPPEQLPPVSTQPPEPALGAKPEHLHMAYKLLSPALGQSEPSITYAGRGGGPTDPCPDRSIGGFKPRVPDKIKASAAAFFGDEYTCAPARALLADRMKSPSPRR
jgi:hypothetical protein